MANKKINELIAIKGRDIAIDIDVLPIETASGTKSVTAEALLEDVIAINNDLLNKCRVLQSKLSAIENVLETTPDKHLIINQYYGGALKIDTGSVSHAFIELYNPTNATIDLTGKSLNYIDAANVWSKLDLTGSIPSKHSFLVRCKLTNPGTSTVPGLDLNEVAGDMEWDTFLSNKGTTIALMNSTTDLAVGVDPQTLDTFIDMIGASDDAGMAVPFFEGQAAFGQSKQKSIRRILLTDTNNNFKDCEIVDFRIKANLVKAPKNVASGAWE